MPKTLRNVYFKNLTFEKLIQAHERAIKGKRNKKDMILFVRDLETNVSKLMDELISGEYKLGKYRVFKIYEPKERIIFRLPYYPDRIA